MQRAFGVVTAGAVLLWGLSGPANRTSALAQTPVPGASTPGVRGLAAVPQAPGRA